MASRQITPSKRLTSSFVPPSLVEKVSEKGMTVLSPDMETMLFDRQSLRYSVVPLIRDHGQPYTKSTAQRVSDTRMDTSFFVQAAPSGFQVAPSLQNPDLDVSDLMSQYTSLFQFFGRSHTLLHSVFSPQLPKSDTYIYALCRRYTVNGNVAVGIHTDCTLVNPMLGTLLINLSQKEDGTHSITRFYKVKDREFVTQLQRMTSNNETSLLENPRAIEQLGMVSTGESVLFKQGFDFCHDAQKSGQGMDYIVSLHLMGSLATS